MSFLTRSSLRSYAPSTSAINEKVATRQRYTASAGLRPVNTVFLSHSHKDADLIFAVKNFLEARGYGVYVDWLDDGMPEKTSGLTATIIKQKINDTKKFAVIISENSKASKWVPWEVGFADKAQTPERILIIPISENNMEFIGIEYMRLYYCLENIGGTWYAYRADPISAVPLDNWLKQ